jgi:hypothetical protein
MLDPFTDRDISRLRVPPLANRKVRFTFWPPLASREKTRVVPAALFVLA